MAQVVVLADPPREGLALPSVPETSPLSAEEARQLYAAFLRDAVVAAEGSGGDTLVNYRPDDLLPEGSLDGDAEGDVRELLGEVLADPEETRFEPQVGSDRSARIGNTVTHLLREEEASGVIVVDPAAPTIGRTGIDEVAMKLRRSDVVVVPSTRGRVAALGFAEPMNFEAVLQAPALTRLTDRAVEAGLEVGYTDLLPRVEHGTDLASLVSLVRARATAGRNLPEFTAAAVDDLGLSVEATDDEVAVVRGTDSS